VAAPAYETDNFRHAFYVLALRGLFSLGASGLTALASQEWRRLGPIPGTEAMVVVSFSCSYQSLGMSDKSSALIH
jgi:hypothetical protein